MEFLAEVLRYTHITLAEVRCLLHLPIGTRLPSLPFFRKVLVTLMSYLFLHINITIIHQASLKKKHLTGVLTGKILSL
jgi:hypothetical protein